MADITFFYTGAIQTFTVPAGVTYVTAICKSPGLGPDYENTVGQSTYVSGNLTVSPGEKFYCYVGGMGTSLSGGWPNGGAPGFIAVTYPGVGPNGGNGNSEVRRGGKLLTDRIMVAGAPAGFGIRSFDTPPSEYFDVGLGVFRYPSVLDGGGGTPPGFPDGPARLISVSGDRGQTIIPLGGVGGVTDYSGTYVYGQPGDDGNLLVDTSTNLAGKGADGTDYVVIESHDESDGLSGPSTLSDPELAGTYESGPRIIYGPFLVPAWGKLNVQVISGTAGFIVAKAADSTTPGAVDRALSLGGPGAGAVSTYDNTTGFEHNLYVWVYSISSPSPNSFQVHISIELGPQSPGSGGGGGYAPGGGGSSNVDRGAVVLLAPDGRYGGGGGGGSSYIDTGIFDFPDIRFLPDVEEAWGPGFIQFTWSVSRFEPLHVPHKDWAMPDELENYLTMERWSYDINQVYHLPHMGWSTPEERENYLTFERWTLDMTSELHFPHKEWATPNERENYLAIERWARRNFG